VKLHKSKISCRSQPGIAGLWAPLGLAIALLLSGSTSAQQSDCAVDSSCYEASHLTGDWWGARTGLAAGGVTLQADSTNFLFGNTTGGVQRAADFGGHGDYVMLIDGEKLGIQDGLSLKIRAEHRYGQTIVSDVGCFISPTLTADLPVFGSDQLYLTNFLLTQTVGDSLAVYAGKMDTLDGDMNAYAHGRGKTQFSNMAFVFNPIVGATVPYSTLGAGFVILREKVPLLTFSILNSTDTTNTSGFKQLFNDGVLLSASLRLPTQLLGMSGHHLLGATWNSQNYTSISEAYIEYPNVAIPTTRGSWSLFWNFDQPLVTFSDDTARGWGTFGRAGIADDNTSPLAWFLSFGIGGDSPLVSRPADTFGVGWYYGGTSNKIGPLITAQYGPIGNGEGVECFYNIQLTEAIRLTPDLQVIVPALEDIGTALVIGVRAQLIF
jgi:porin